MASFGLSEKETRMSIGPWEIENSEKIDEFMQNIGETKPT